MKWKQYLTMFTAAVLLSGCTSGRTVTAGYDGPATVVFEPTEENANPELMMAVQPEASHWFPKELLAWDADEDRDLPYNLSVVPLAQRAEQTELQTVNDTQNRDTRVMAISIMNSSTSGNSPRGLNKADCNTFAYWQYVDTLVYWGGSSGEGLIVAPSPDVVDAGHKNGVRVTGTIFFPQTAHGGKIEWLNDFLVKDEAGNFPMVDKLIEVAQTYGFDGWFFNQETEGTQQEPLTPEHAQLMQGLIRSLKEKAPELEIIYYDSMTSEGRMDWQNALTDANISFLKDKEGNPAADSMFLNFWWTNDRLAGQQLLKASAEKAENNGIDPYSLYAGIDIQSDGYLTPVKWKLLEKSKDSTYTSIGIYCPNWAYTSSDDMEEFWKKENAIWVNSKGDPTLTTDYSSEEQWRGVSTYAVERTAITSLPFTTNFCMGNGYNFFINGELASKMDWNNRSLSDILPTYRWIIRQDGNNSLKADMNAADAYYGGNSLKLWGNIEKGSSTNITLYSASLPVTDKVSFTTTAKSNIPARLDAVVELEDGSKQILKADKELLKDWTTVAYDMSGIQGRTIKSLSYVISTQEDESQFELCIGNITIAKQQEERLPVVSEVQVDDKEFDEDAVYAGVRLSWKSDIPAEYYEVYRVNQNGTRSLLGVTNINNFYVNALQRTGEERITDFLVVPVTKLLKPGSGANVSMEWPDNSLPKAGFTADKTLVAPGEEIRFTSMCSPNTNTVTWDFTGAAIESSTDEAPVVSYPKEGIYGVSITAENSSGKTGKTLENYIVVSNKALGGQKLLSQEAPVEASSYVNEQEAPRFAVDGKLDTKWCATGAAPHELTIDLLGIRTVCAVDISHAEAGGEGKDMNSKDYTIMVSSDGADYTEVVHITKNTSKITHDTFAPVDARYVRLIVNKPAQGSDNAARIYEVQVYGVDETVTDR